MTDLRTEELSSWLPSDPARWQRIDRLLLAVGSAAALVVGWVHRADLLLAAGLMAVTVVSARLAFIDFREHRLPNHLTGRLAAGVSAGVVVLALRDGDIDRATGPLLAGVICLVALFVLSIAGGIGMGDAKYGYSLAVALAWFGWATGQLAIVVTCVAGAGVAAAVLLSRSGSRRMAYGPYMALGFVVAVLHAGSF